MESWVREWKPDAIVHLAAQASGAESLERPAATYRVNALGALNLLEAARVSGSKAAILIVGSADIYGSGPAEARIREDAPIRPRNPYAVSKAAQDSLGEVYAATYGLRVVVRAYRLLLERGEAGEAYNVATGRGYVLRELLDRLVGISRVRAQVKTDPTRLRARDVDHLVGDPGKLEARTGWTPAYSIDQTLADLFRDARERVRRETGR